MSTSAGTSRDHGPTSPSLGVSPRNDSSRSIKPDAATDAARDAASSAAARSGAPTLESSAAARAVSGLHDAVGNGVISASLSGGDVGGMGPVVSDGLTAAVGGLDGSDLLGSNAAMADVMRDAAVDEGLDMEKASLAISASSGRPLAPHHQERFERAFDHDFGHVRVHTSGTAAMAARELNAHAFALGAEVFFGSGEFAPGTARGDRLLAHELTHVVQHDEGRLPGGGGVSKPSDPHEVEAYANEGVIVKELSHVDQELSAEARGELVAEPEVDRDGGSSGGLELVEEFLGGAVEDIETVQVELDGPGVEAPVADVGLGAVGSDASTEEDSSELELDAAGLDAGGGFAAADPGAAGVPDPGGDASSDGAIDAAAPSLAAASVSRRSSGASGSAGASRRSNRRRMPGAVAQRIRFSLGESELELDEDQAEQLVAMPSLGIDKADGPLAQDEQETVYERLDEVGAMIGEPPTLELIDQGGVIDSDPERHALTLQLLARLGATLGLSGVNVRVDERSTQRVRALGTRGVMENGEVLLDADAYDPSTVDGQALLAHEVMHVAQERLATPSTSEVISDLAPGADAGMLVEGEAQSFADAFVSGQATPDAVVAMPDGHSAQEGNPASELKALYAQFDENMKTKKDATQAKADATAPPKKSEGEETKENREEKLDAYEEGLEEIADDIEDKDAFEELGDALDDDEPKERDAAMSRIRSSEKYDQLKKQWTGAKNAEHDAGPMKKMWDDKFYDRGWGDDELAWNYVARKAKSEAVEDELAEQARKDLEESKGAEKPGDPEKEEGEKTEAGEGGTGAGGAGGEAGTNPRAAEAVTKEFPATPAFEAAHGKKVDVAPLVSEQWTHYDKHTGEIQKAAEGGFASRAGVVFEEVGSQFVGGLAKGFVGGLQDGATDTLAEFGDKALTGLTKGKLPGKVSYVGSAVSLYQSGLLTGDFSKFGDQQKQAVEKIGKSASSGMEMWEKAGEASGVDAFGLYCASIADWLQAAIDAIDMVANILGTLSAICYVVGGVLILVGMALAWLGIGAGMISAGMWLVRAGNTIGKIKDVLDKITAILKPIRTVLRVIAAFTVPADVFAEQVGALGDTAESYGENKGKAVASTTVQEMKDHAAKKKDPNASKEGAPEDKTVGEGEAGADGELGEKKAKVDKELDELEKGKKLVEDANKKAAEEDEGGGKKSRKDIIDHGKEEGPESLSGKLADKGKKGLKKTLTGKEDGEVNVKNVMLSPLTHMKSKFTDLGTSMKAAKDDMNEWKSSSQLKQYEMMLGHNEKDELMILESLKQGKVVKKKKASPDSEMAVEAKKQLEEKKQKLEGEVKKAEQVARNQLNHLEQVKKNGDDPEKIKAAEAEFKKLQTELAAADKAYNDAVSLEQKIANAEFHYRETKEERKKYEQEQKDAEASLPGQKEQLDKDKQAADDATSEYDKKKAEYDKQENQIKAKEAVVKLREGHVFFKPSGKGKRVKGTVVDVRDGELVVRTSKGEQTIKFDDVNGPTDMRGALSDLKKAETGPYGLKPQDISTGGLGTDISVGRNDLEEQKAKLAELKEAMEAAKTTVSETEKGISDNEAKVNGPHPETPSDLSTWQQVFSKDAKGIEAKEAKSVMGLLSNYLKTIGAPEESEEDKKKKEAAAEAKKSETRADKADAAVESLKKSDDDKKKEKDAADAKKNPYEKANEWWGSAGKNSSDFIVKNLSGARVSDLVSKKPPNDMDEMSSVYEEAEAEAKLFAEKHMQAYEAFQAERVAKDEITMQEFLLETGEQQLKPAVDKQAEPMAQGKKDATERDSKVQGVEFGTEKSDDGIMGFITGLVQRLMSNDDYVEGGDEGTEDMASSSTEAQDKVDEDAKKNKEEMAGGSKDTVAVLDKQEESRSAVRTLLDTHTEEINAKKECDEGLLGEIQSMKASYLEERDAHKAKMEGKATEYNEMMDGMAIWAADYKTRRENWGKDA